MQLLRPWLLVEVLLLLLLFLLLVISFTYHIFFLASGGLVNDQCNNNYFVAQPLLLNFPDLYLQYHITFFSLLIPSKHYIITKIIDYVSSRGKIVCSPASSRPSVKDTSRTRRQHSSRCPGLTLHILPLQLLSQDLRKD